ncbi:hypothetical protein SBA4_3630010 [Candidatus Sulfopaludibacter sp. SbA4]|nr:hypothetical protein SBA4_3630010 [Candidatus Sulfopaludibacter sp. SbA4]
MNAGTVNLPHEELPQLVPDASKTLLSRSWDFFLLPYWFQYPDSGPVV